MKNAEHGEEEGEDWLDGNVQGKHHLLPLWESEHICLVSLTVYVCFSFLHYSESALILNTVKIFQIWILTVSPKSGRESES